MRRIVFLLSICGWILPTVDARAADIEKLGQPCRARQILGSAMVTDRQDGRERLILLNDNEAAHCELLYIDFEKNTAESYFAPAGAGSWCGIEVPGDFLVVGTFYDGALMGFDLRAKKFTKVVRVPGESYIWNLVLGGDGRVYGGTYPRGKLFALDLQSWTVDDCKAPAAPNQYCRYVSATPWGEIVAGFGMGRPTTGIYDPKTRSWRQLPELAEGQRGDGHSARLAGETPAPRSAKGSFRFGVCWNGLFVAYDPRTGSIEAFSDRSFQPARPSPLPPLEGFALESQLCTPSRLFVRKGNTLYECIKSDLGPELKKLAHATAPGCHFMGVAKDGTVVGTRGQAYFVLRGDKLELRLIAIEPQPRPTLFLQADPAGRLWGGPHFGQTLFHYNIRTGESINTDVICDSGGEVYDVTFRDGLVYAVSYAGGDITVYDPAQAWDQVGHHNPRPLARVGPKGYIRPQAGIELGSDGKLYAGWWAGYGSYGGAVSITDPKTGQTDLIENPLGRQAICSIAVGSKHLYIGTTLAGNGLPHQKDQAKFGVVDLATRKVVFEKTFAAASVTRLCREPKRRIIAFTAGSHLHFYGPKPGQLRTDPVPKLPALTAGSLLAAGDGSLLAASGNKILRIDPAAGTFSMVLESPAPVDTLTLASDGRIYFSSGPDLYGSRLPMAVMATRPAPR